MGMIIPYNTVLTTGARCPSPPPSERLPTHFRAPGDTMGDVQYGSRCAINTWHVSTVGIYWQIQTR